MSYMAIRALSRRPTRLLPSSLQLKLRSFANPTEINRKPQLVNEISIANLFRKHGFPFPSNLHELIKNNQFLLRSASSDLDCSIALLQSFGFSQNSFHSIISACPRILDLDFLKKWQKCFSELGLSNAASISTIRTILEQSAKLRIDPEDFLHNSLLMRTAGLNDNTLVRIFMELPAAFMRDGIDVCRRIKFLEKIVRIVDTKEEINRICHSYPKFLAFGVDGRLRPLFAELSDLGFDRNEIRKLLNQNPGLLLGLETGELSRCMNLLQGLKCRAPIKERLLASGRLHAAFDVKLRIDFLCDHGLTRRDAFKILHVEPRTILYSLQDLEEKIQFLLHKLGYNIDHLVEYPDYLGLNLKNQIYPRLRVVELLKSKGAIEMEVELKHFVRLSRSKFYNLFVKPYPECEKIFGGLIRDVRVYDVKVKTKHPTGLWKLFKPQKYSDSQEDLKNMKQFMETLV